MNTAQDKKHVDHNGYWYIENNPISRTGVFPYLGKQISDELEPDKVYQVYRPAEELFSPEAMASFELMPLVDDHTMLGKDYTPAEQKGIEGVLGEKIERSGDMLTADIKIYSESLKDEIRNGKKELSLGYFCDYDLTPGTYKGQHYDAVQRNLRGNHIALVDKGRMGRDVRVMDKALNMVKDCPVHDSIELPANDDSWITVKPNGPEHKGQHVQISESGEIKAGMGGKFNGLHIGMVAQGRNESKKEQTKRRKITNLEKKQTAAKSAPKEKQEVLSKFKDYLKSPKMQGHFYEAVKAAEWEGENTVGSTYFDSDRYLSLFGDKLTPEQYSYFDQEELENMLFEELNNMERSLGFKDKKKNFNGSDEAAVNKENTMDRREVIREIMAIAAKDPGEFKGGEEEKIKTVSALAEKLAYAKGKEEKPDADEITTANPGETETKTETITETESTENKEEEEEQDAAKCDAEQQPMRAAKVEIRAVPAKGTDEAIISKAINRINEMAEFKARLTPYIGEFDISKMHTVADVADYGLRKLGKKAKGDKVAYLEGCLSEMKQERQLYGMASDGMAADEMETDTLDEILKGVK